MGSTASRIAKSAVSIIIISTFSKFLGLMRESVTAAYFGANYLTDAFKVAFEIPSILTGVIYAAISITFIPVYSDLKDKPEKEKLYFVNNLFNVIMLITAVIALLGILFAGVLVGIVAPGFSGKTFDLCVQLLVLMFPSIIFLAMAYLANGYLQSSRNFVAPAFMGISLNLIMIISVIFFSHQGIRALAVGSLIAMMSQIAIQIPFVIKAGFRFQPVIDFKEPGLKKVLVLSLPVLISTLFGEASVLIDKILGSGLSAGSISVLDYAGKVNGIANGIFFASLAIVFFPELSLASDDLNKFAKAVAMGLKIVILISFPVTVGLWVLRMPIIRLLFERGEFGSESTIITSIALGIYSIGVIGSGLTAILNRAFYSLKDTKTPMINGIVAICTNIVLSLILVRFLGVYGVALSSASASLLCGLSIFLRIRKKIKISLGQIGKTIAKAAVSAVIMGALIYVTGILGLLPPDRDMSSVSLLLRLSVTIGIGCFIYTGILYMLKTEELVYALKLLRYKVRAAEK